MADLALRMERNRTAVWDLTFTKDGVALPLTDNRVVWFGAKLAFTDSNADAIVLKNSDDLGGIEITDAANGLARLTIDPADTDDVSKKKIAIELKCEFTVRDGDIIDTPDGGRGTLTVEQDVVDFE